MANHYTIQEKQTILDDLIAALDATHPDPNQKKQKPKRVKR